MEKKDFLYFTQDELIKNIKIDPRLVDSFKRVMATIQEYFDANGYSTQRNYKEYLEKYLLNSGDNNLRFYINKIEREGVGGFYNRSRHEICINEELLKTSSDRLDSTLCHEFIHFLVKHSLEKGKSSDEILYGGFINEALTEMLTQQMYPNSHAYDAQVSMQKFANLVSGKNNNYKRFLEGYVDAQDALGRFTDWNRYVAAANQFQKDFNQKGYITLIEAWNNPNFLDAQRQLIEMFIKPSSSKTFAEYCECINKLIQRPVPDKEYINQVVSKMDNAMINGLGIKNQATIEFLKGKLSEVRNLIGESKKYGGKRVYEFKFAGRTLAIDEDLKLLGNRSNITKGWNPQTRIVTIQLNDEKLQFNFDDLSFDLREKEIQSKIGELSSYFSSNLKGTLSMLDKALEQSGELTKIEKFSLPNIAFNGKKTSHDIYVATYGDKLVVLNDYEQIRNMSNILLSQYIGINPSEFGEIYSKNIGMIENGISFCTLSSKMINRTVIREYSKEIAKSVSAEELAKAIDQYKSGDFYAQDDTEEEIKEQALRIIAAEKFDSLSDAEKQKFIAMVKDQSDRFIVTMKDGKVDVALLSGDKIAYNAQRQVLYDKNSEGLYNDLYEELKSKEKSKIDDRRPISIDKNGNIIIEKPKPVVTVQPPSSDEFVQQKELNPNAPPTVNNIQEGIGDKEHNTGEKKSSQQSEKNEVRDFEEKKKLEEQRRELRRKQFEDRTKKIGLDQKKVPNLNDIFQQQKQQQVKRQMEEEQENEMEHGMSM